MGSSSWPSMRWRRGKNIDKWFLLCKNRRDSYHSGGHWMLVGLVSPLDQKDSQSTDH